MKPCVTSGAAVTGRGDARPDLPDDGGRVVLLDHRDPVIHLRIGAVKVSLCQRREERVADHHRIETHDREAEDRNLRRAVVVVRISNSVTGATSVLSSPSATDIDASRRDPGSKPRPRCTWKPMKRVASPSRILIRSSGHSASSNASACRSIVQPQFFGWNRRRAVEQRQRGARRPSTSHTSRRASFGGAIGPRRIALRVGGPVLIADRLTVDLQADERARQPESNSVANCAAAVLSVRCMRSRSAVLNWPSH